MYSSSISVSTACSYSPNLKLGAGSAVFRPDKLNSSTIGFTAKILLTYDTNSLIAASLLTNILCLGRI